MKRANRRPYKLEQTKVDSDQYNVLNKEEKTKDRVLRT